MLKVPLWWWIYESRWDIESKGENCALAVLDANVYGDWNNISYENPNMYEKNRIDNLCSSASIVCSNVNQNIFLKSERTAGHFLHWSWCQLLGDGLKVVVLSGPQQWNLPKIPSGIPQNYGRARAISRFRVLSHICTMCTTYKCKTLHAIITSHPTSQILGRKLTRMKNFHEAETRNPMSDYPTNIQNLYLYPCTRHDNNLIRGSFSVVVLDGCAEV